MTPISILILLVLSVAAGWSGYLVVRTAEGRLRLLAGVVGLVVLGHLIPRIVAVESWAIQWSFDPGELVGLGMGVGSQRAMLQHPELSAASLVVAEGVVDWRSCRFARSAWISPWRRRFKS